MADIELVDPTLGTVLGAHAYGTVAAGTASAAWPVRLRYKWGLSGSGLNSSALVLEVSEDGGSTYRAATTEFTLAITDVVNVPLDPLYTETIRSLGRGSRFRLAPLRAGCAVDLNLTFTPDLRPGAATTAYTFRLGVNNDPWQTIALVPDAPYGVLSGLGCPDVSEWITAPTLANGQDLVTMGAAEYVHEGIRYALAAGDVAHDQNDGASEALVETEEYISVQSVGASGRTVTKGLKATAGTAVAPALPVGELPEVTARVPFGGVIATSTLHAVSGRCAVSDAGGLVVAVQPGRVQVPGYLVTPPVAQTLTLADDATSTVRMSASGAPSVTAGAPLAVVVTSGGDIVSVTDARRLLGLEMIRLRQAGDETAGTAVDRIYVPYAWTIDSAEVRVRVASTGATGSTDVNVELAGTTFASGSIAAQASSAACTFGALSGVAGWITLDVAAVTSGGTRAADIEVVLWIARV